MVQAATEFKKSGYSDDDSAQLAQVAALYQNVADSEMSASDSSAYLISQMKAFNITADDAITIIDKTNEVSNSFAVSSTDVSTALTKTSSAMSAYGNTIDETIGMTTAATEVMTGQAGKVSKGLRSIGANITKLASSGKSLDYTINGAAKSISLFDKSTGDMKNTYQVLSEIASGWDNMTNAEKSSLALSLAGKTQIDVFTSELGNFDDAIKATSTSINSAGSATKENAKYMESLSAKINNLKAQAQKLVLGDGGFNSLLKTLVDLGTAILKFANSDIGQAVIQFAVLYAILTKLSGTKIGVKLQQWATYMVTLGSDTATTTGLVGGLNGVLSQLDALLTTLLAHPIILAITGVIAAITLMVKMHSEHNKKLKELNDSLSEYESELKQLKQQESLSSAEKDRLEYLQKKIDLTNQLADATKKANDDNDILGKIGDFGSTVGSVAKGFGDTVTGKKTGVGSGFTVPKNGAYNSKTSLSDSTSLQGDTKEIQSQIDAYSKLRQEILSYNDASEAGIKILDEKQTESEKDLQNLESIRDMLISQKDAQGNLTESQQTELDALNNIINAQDDATDSGNAYSDAVANYGEGSDEAAQALDDLADACGMSAEELQAGSEAMGLSIDQYSDFATQLNNLSSNYDTLNEAQKELNETGSLTAETFLKLSNNNLLQYLQNVNGQLTTTTGGLNDEAEAAKITAINQLQNAAAHDIAALAIGDVDKMSQGAQAAVKKVGDNAKTAGSDAATAAPKVAGLAVSIQGLIDASKGKLTGGMDLKTFEADATAIKNYYVGIAKGIGDISISGASSAGKASKSAGSAAKSAGSAAKSTTDTYKENYTKQKDLLDHKLAMEEISQENYYKQLYALNEQYFGEASGQHDEYLDDYQKNEETMYKGIKSMLKDRAEDVKDALKDQENAALDAMDKQIDAVKNAESAALDAIDNQIDALKDQKDAALDAIDAEIEATKKEKDACETYWNDKIDAFKKANDELTEQNKLMELQQALAAAQSTKVKIFQGGQFTYGQDEESVDTAQENLDEYQDELKYEKELQALEDSRDAALEVYDQKIENLQNYRDSVEEQYDAEIKAMENHRDEVQEQYDAELDALEAQKEALKEQYDSQIENYEATEKKLFDDQVDAITSENNNWTARLQNLAAFVTQYNSMINSLSSGGAVTSGYKGVSVKARASGDSSINKSGAYIVGENPNKEIVLGSKLNNGVGINLSKGSGVVNAKSTSTLAGLLNNLGEISGIGATSNNNTTKSVNNNFNITANVANGEGLVDYLQNFSTRMTQQAFA